jgi:hypothetical protein
LDRIWTIQIRRGRERESEPAGVNDFTAAAIAGGEHSSPEKAIRALETTVFLGTGTNRKAEMRASHLDGFRGPGRIGDDEQLG